MQKALFSLLFCAEAALAAPCRFSVAPRLLHEADNSLPAAFVATVTAEVFHQEEFEPSPQHRQYLNWLSSHANRFDAFDQQGLLERQRAIYARLFPGSSETRKFDVVLSGRGGELAPMGCVEYLLFDFQNRRHPLRTTTGEFAAYAVEQADGNVQLLIQSSGVFSVRSDPAVESLLEHALTAGGELLFHLHNHPFMPDNSTGDVAGTCVPSGTRRGYGDLATYETLARKNGMQEFRITNGVTTLRAPVATLANYD